MIISDLNHIEAVEAGQVVGGSYYYYPTYFQKDVVKLDVKTDIDLDDNSAVANADSVAYGDKTFTKTDTFTFASDYSSASSSKSIAAVD
ncbi:hypothetical protein [Fischerella sp. PCC 9605]|uniref:hypothetical protein n=1 Tax=Fischerella sp. PCC 9605 TaxID=1173024 RepID=UPI0004BBBFDE|nr:hypothetical protein [Fischerella sp. PCC 9605]